MHFNRKSRSVLAVASVVTVATLATVGAALAFTSSVFADANTVNSGTFHSDQGVVKLHTKGSVRIRDVQTIGAPPGFSSGWHTHPGPILVAMSSTSAGSLTLYDEDCNRTTIGANQAYIEKPNSLILARNESTANADWVSTMIVPIGVPFTVPVDNGRCNP
jgi:hypothetical protein